MNSLRHLSDALLKETLRNAIYLKLEKNFCATLKNEIQKRRERSEYRHDEDNSMTDIFER
ncbi:sporulation histidine kinase inhibitor Sda [Oceanobacillus timonensis]|uniref:sporulation histidine kinase inhibitor Sda n=1 Tax=Oceanobacillus timonensis TaxID=1926285 RepID=UPI0009BAF418|nr:sporulation histidine kinase inhibitor Sda [Oceanobacillus timonensis]